MKKFKLNKRIALPIAIVILLAPILTFLFSVVNKQPDRVQAAWYSSSWNYRQQITIDHTKVSNTDQSNFPVLVKITDESNPVFDNAQADGDDILFTSSDETTKLSHEIETFDATNHLLWAWVKVPTLSASIDTMIYLYYGYSEASNQQNISDVWSNSFLGVWHINESSSTVYDSTSNNVDSASQSMTYRSSGKVGYSGGFNGTSDNINFGDVNAIDGLSQLTITSWVKTTNTNEDDNIVTKGQQGTNQPMIMFKDDSVGGGSQSGNTDALSVLIYDGDTQAWSSSASGTLGDTNWHHTAFTFTGNTAGGLKPFVDGVNTTSASTVNCNSIQLNNNSLIFGAPTSASGTQWLNGSLDEVRISSTARSADWIATENANQNSPDTFILLGSQASYETDPPTNPTSVTALYSEGGDPITNNAGYGSTPYYSWPDAEAAGGASDSGGSGVHGYYSYFGTSCGAGGADPVISRGALSDTGSGLHYSTDTNVSVPDLTTNQGTYCLRIRTGDNGGNISADTWQAAIYYYDTTAPNAPSFVVSNPAGYSSTNSFDFSWPAATDVAGSGSSGLLGYQYKRGGTSGDSWSTTQTARTAENIVSYQEGTNIFMVRSIDNAGNASSEVQTTYYYSSDVPVKPTALTANPEISDTNSFSFSWTAPAHSRPIVDYGYSINASPTNDNITWTGSSSTSLSAGPYATIQGANTFYFIAKDDAGAYSFESASVATATFTCQTAAPPIPTGIVVSDSSNRSIDLWALTIKWSAGIGQDPDSLDHYVIERSTDPDALNGTGFTTLATATSTAYIDSNSLNNTTTYYYRIKAVDNAAKEGAYSSIVYRMPSGKYTSPPSIVTEPTVEVKSTTATISWVVNRESTSSVRFGISSDNLTRSQIDPTTKTSQSIELAGLEPNTLYYYQVQALDSEREYASDSAFSATYSFNTLASPTIANVAVSNITLYSADISWETTTASNTKAYYGSTIGYGLFQPENNNSMTTQHTVTLSNLNHTTKYHFKISGDDIDGNNLTSDDYTFDTLPLPIISSVQYDNDNSGPEQALAITWLTNVATTSSVEYTPINTADKLSYEESQSALVINHRVLLSNLEDNTNYTFTLSGSDQFGNKAISDQYVLITSFDTRPAVISNITIETSNVGLDKQDKAQIVVSWQTDEPSTSMVEYSEGISGSDYTQRTTEDKALTTSHLVIISDLTPNKPYHIRVVSTDKGNNISTSQDHTVIPGDVPRSALQIILQTFTRLFGWMGV